MDIQLVIRRRKAGTAREGAVLALVDQPLRVLDAHAHRKGLRLHRDPRRVQHLERVARAVTDRKEQLRTRKLRLFAVLHRAHRRKAAVFHPQARQPCAEAHLAAVVQDLFAQILHDRHQNVRPDVGLGVK